MFVLNTNVAYELRKTASGRANNTPARLIAGLSRSFPGRSRLSVTDPSTTGDRASATRAVFLRLENGEQRKATDDQRGDGEHHGRPVGRLLAQTKTADVVDAHLVITAVGLGHDILTGEPNDFTKLTTVQAQQPNSPCLA